MYCKICGKLITGKNKYDLIHNKFICTTCIETHQLDTNTELSQLQELIDSNKKVSRPFLVTLFYIIIIVNSIYTLYISSQYYHHEHLLYKWLLLTCMLLGLAHIIMRLESMKGAE